MKNVENLKTYIHPRQFNSSAGRLEYGVQDKFGCVAHPTFTETLLNTYSLFDALKTFCSKSFRYKTKNVRKTLCVIWEGIITLPERVD